MATILLADDDPAVRELVRRALVQEGHTVLVTEDGAEALEQLAARGGAIDMVVTDVNMPQVDGITLAREALRLKATVALLLMSGYADQLERAGTLPAQKIAVISKPFTLEQIKSKVRGIL